MCGIAEAGLALSAVGTVASGYGMYAQGQQAKAQGDYQSAVAANNAAIAAQNAAVQERAAQDALARGRIDEQQHRLKVSQMKGAQRSALAASGVQVDSGSALDVLADTAMFGEMDALTIRSNAEREAYSARIGAHNARAQGMNNVAESNLFKLAGANSARSGMIGAGSTFLGGAGRTAMDYALWKKA